MINLFKYLNIKKYETIWFDFRIASYIFLKFKKIYILNKHLTFYRQLENSASKNISFFPKIGGIEEIKPMILYLF